MALTLWIQQGNNIMRKLPRPSKRARIVKQINGDWYICWRCNSQRFRPKYNLNYIKDLEIRQLWANRIVSFVNTVLDKGDIFLEESLPLSLIPPPEHHTLMPINTEGGGIICTYQRYIKLKIIEGKSDNYIRSLTSLKNNIVAFASSEGFKDYMLESIDKNWGMRYKEWCIQKPREHSANTIAKQLRSLRTILKEAEVEEELTVNKAYKTKHFKHAEIDTDQIALNFDEILKLKNLTLEGFETYEKIRDNFIVACFTALRFGDWQIKKGNIVDFNGKKMIKVFTQKTKEMVLIPLHPVADEILRKYDYDLPHFSNQTSNEYMKIIAEKAGIDDNEVLKKSKGGKAVQVFMPRFKAITTHTARRTFITLALFELNIPSVLVMKITGHKSERQLFRYARIGKERAAILMAKAMEEYFDKFMAVT